MSQISKLFELPPIDDFIVKSKPAIRQYLERHEITTVYFPIDGTRRHFIASTGIDYSSPSFFKKYFEFVIPATIRTLKSLLSFGLKHIIVLLMDNTAFDRGISYVENAIKYGIEPLYQSQQFLNFYKDYGLNVYFSGFNQVYRDLGFEQLYNDMSQFNKIQAGTSQDTINYYTGTSSIQDYVELVKLYQKRFSTSKNANLTEELNKQNIIKLLYGHSLSPIDLTFYYGFQPHKIKPILLWGNEVSFYTKNPSLSLSEIQIKKALYITIQRKNADLDNKKEYHDPDAISNQMIMENTEIIGESLYSL